jgi:tRNA(Ile2) C34 agmatinyltransferase TiaS
MIQKNQLEKRSKICPQCKEKMTALYNSKGKVAYYECANCGNLLSATKGVYFIKTTQSARP